MPTIWIKPIVPPTRHWTSVDGSGSTGTPPSAMSTAQSPPSAPSLCSLSTVPVPSIANPTVPVQSVLTVQCWMDCGTTAGLQNIGNTRCPRMMCGPCVSAKKAMDAQGRSSPENKAKLTLLKANLFAYKEAVRNSRLSVALVNGNTAEARAALHERKQALTATFAVTAESRTAIASICDVLWLCKRAYIAHHMYVKGYTEEEAAYLLTVYS